MKSMSVTGFFFFIITAILMFSLNGCSSDRILIQEKLDQLCKDNPKMVCYEIKAYCYESLEKGRDCVLDQKAFNIYK